MTERILSEEQREELKNSIEINGGEVIDPKFSELEDYLRRNPPDEVIKYLDN